MSFKDFRTKVAWTTLVALFLAIAATQLCLKFQIFVDMPTGLFGIAVVFPLVFTINSAFTRREQSLAYYGDFIASLSSIYFAHSSYYRAINQEKRNKSKTALEKSKSELKDLEVTIKRLVQLVKDDLHASNKQKTNRLEIYKLFQMISDKNYVVQSSTERFFANDALACFEKLSSISNYRTPISMRIYLRLFIYIFPICFAPYFATIEAQAAYIGLLVATLYVAILFILSAIQDHLENPFDGQGLDDIDLDEKGKFVEFLE